MPSPPQQTANIAPYAPPRPYTDPAPEEVAQDTHEQLFRQTYGRQLQGLSGSAAHFMPYGQYDVTFMSLRITVFQVEPTSATPIAQVIREELDDLQICDLLKNVHWTNVKVNGHLERRIVNAEALRKKMDEARIQHARNLADGDFVDVDVIYKCEHYRVEPFKSDKEFIMKIGGRPYHMYPWREKEKEMAFSVIIRASLLDKMYSEERRKRLNIIIKTNTVPKEDDTPEPPKMTRPGTMFPYESPADRHMSGDQKCKNVVESFSGRKRSESIQKVKAIPKNPSTIWCGYSSGTRAGTATPSWSAGNRPFSSDPGVHGDDQWWVEDLEKRKGLIDEWHEATWQELDNGGFGRLSSRSSPGTAVAGKDFLVVPPLSDTFTDNRSYKWHADNVERADKAKRLAAYKSAEQEFNGFVRQVEHFFGRYTALQCDFSMERKRWQEEMQGALNFEKMVRRDFKVKVGELEEKAKKCGMRLEKGKFEIVDQLGLKMQKVIVAAKRQRERSACAKTFPAPVASTTQRHATPTLQLLPRTTYDGGNCKQQASDKPAIAPASHSKAIAHQATPCLQKSACGTGAVPFPAYKDPMTGHTQDIAGTQQDIRKPSGLSRARSNTAKALAAIRSQAGALRHQQPRVDSAQTSGNAPCVAKSVRFALGADSRPASNASNGSDYTTVSDSDYTTSDAESEALYSTGSDGAGDHKASMLIPRHVVAVEVTPPDCKGSTNAVVKAIPIQGGRGRINR